MVNNKLEIDCNKTRANARDILKDFRRVAILTGKLIDKQEDLTMSNDNIVRQGIKMSYEYNELIKAVHTLKGKYFNYIFYYYLRRNKLDHKAIGELFNVTPKQVERSKSTALMRFVKAYKNGLLVEYK